MPLWHACTRLAYFGAVITTDHKEPPLFKFYKCDDYLALPRNPQPWLIEKLVPKGGAMNLFGQPKTSKSFAALGIASAISDPKCTHFLGHPVLEHGRVSYLQVDTPRDEWAGRVERLKAAGYSFDNVHFTDANLVPYPMEITEEAIRESLKAAIDEQKPLLLVVDTLREVHGQDENDSTGMRLVINSLVQATKSAGCGLLMISHSRKEGGLPTKGGGQPANSVVSANRGSGYVAGRMDVIAQLTEKQLILKGRSIADRTLRVERDPSTYMLSLDKQKGEAESHLHYVLAVPDISDRARGDMLAALLNISVEAGRGRIRQFRERDKRSASERPTESDET